MKGNWATQEQNIKEMMCKVIELTFFEATGTRGRKKDIEDAQKFIKTQRLDDFIDMWQLDVNPNCIRRSYNAKMGHHG